MSNASENCWDFMKCSNEDRFLCSAYKNNAGRECWMVAGIISDNPECKPVKEGLLTCWECPWYKEMNKE